ncbi:MAG: hypothetical protein EOO09_03755 [Chitinophagaceae bacterium]|nr:MAG: hypothetical protein EOO09_03755 [Chitinophagaceae bacterium]
MKLRKLKKTDYLMIAANLVPVYGVWFLGWHPLDAFIAYALETLLVGGMTVLKLLIATFYKKKDTWYNGEQKQEVSGLFFILFFMVHFGIFVGVQMAIFSGVAGVVPDGKSSLYFLTHFPTFLTGDVRIMLSALLLGYLAQDILPFVLNNEYKDTPMIKIMFQPYGRIFVQQFTVILGSMFLMLGGQMIFVLVFALIKIFFELLVNYRAMLDSTVLDMQKEAKTKV